MAKSLLKTEGKKVTTHKQIMHTAKKLFEEEGISGVKIERIAHETGISRSTFFTHFSSLDQLLRELADEEIKDLFAAARNSNRGVFERVLLCQLVDDTVPYPYLCMELFVKNLLSRQPCNFQELDDALQKTISESSSYNAVKKEFSPKEISALLIGSYFGLVFQKFMRGENFGDGEDVKLTINKFITLITNRMEDKL